MTIQRSRKGSRDYFHAKVGIAGTRRQPHDLAASIFGGNVTRYVPKNPRHRAQFQWSRTGQPALAVIEVVLPYLRVKERQARLAVQLQDTIEVAPFLYPATFRPAILALYDEVRELNQSRWRRDEFPECAASLAGAS